MGRHSCGVRPIGYCEVLCGVQNTGYRPKCVSGRSLLGGTVVFGGAVEVVPGDPGSVEHRAYRNFCGALGLVLGVSRCRWDISCRCGIRSSRRRSRMRARRRLPVRATSLSRPPADRWE